MKKWLIITIITSIILAVIAFGVVRYINRNKIQHMYPTSEKELANAIEQNLEEINVQIVSTSANQEKTTPSTQIRFETYYEKCEHTNSKNINIPEEQVNMTKEEFEKEYKEWKVEQFDTNTIILKTQLNEICKEHYILKEKEGYVAIYTFDEFGNETLKEVTGVVISYLPEADIMELKEGIKVYGREKLNARLEDYE